MPKKPITAPEWVAIVTSILALMVAAFLPVRDAFFGQHVLRASVVSLEEASGQITATILLVNAGRNYETLYKARFIFSDDLASGGGSLSKESVGPLVIPPGQAKVVQLKAPTPNVLTLREQGVIKRPSGGVHLGVLFDVISQAGELPEEGKVYRITELLYDASGVRTGNKPRTGDHNSLLALL